MASPVCLVGGLSTANGVNVTPSSSVTITLQSVAGVNVWAIRCVNTDDLHDADTITASMSVNYITKTATFTAPANNSALIFESRVNQGVRNGVADSSLVATFGVYSVTTTAERVVAANERNEGNTQFGWVSVLNNVSRAVGGGVISGDTKKAVTASALVAGDLVTSANDPTDPKKVTKATTAALAVGLNVIGICIATYSVGQTAEYADINARVDGSITGLAAGTNTWGVASSAGRVVRKDIPDPTDAVVGPINAQGDVQILPRRPVRSLAAFGQAPYYAVNDYSAGVSDSLRAASDASKLTDIQLNFSSRVLEIPKGVWNLDKPIHMKTAGQLLRGASDTSTHLRALTFAGPALYFAADNGAFPTVAADFASGAVGVFKHEAQVQNEHWLALRPYGAGTEFHGKSTISLEFILKINATSLVTDSFIFTSYGERFSDDGIGGVDFSIGVRYCGSTGVLGHTDCVAFTLTTTAGLLTIFSANSSLPQGVYKRVECQLAGGTMSILIDGVVSGSTGSLAGSIVQKYWENTQFCGVYKSWYGQRLYNGADFNLASCRFSTVARNTAGAPTVRYTEDANTMLLVDFMNLDGVFVKCRSRGDATSATLVDTYFPHRRDSVAVATLPDAGVEDFYITNNFGPMIDCNGAVKFDIRNIQGVGKCGIKLENNCYKSTVHNINILASAYSPRAGIQNTGAGNVISYTNMYVSGFVTNVVVTDAGDVGFYGSLYTTVSNMHLWIQNTLNVNFLCESEISDEASTLGGRLPDCFLGMQGVQHFYASNFQTSQVESSVPLVVYQGDGPLGDMHYQFDVPYLKTTATGGLFKCVGAAPAGEIVVNGGTLLAGSPVLTAGSADGARVIVHPEADCNAATVALSGTTFTISRDVWLRNKKIKFTGVLAAGCTVTVPRAKIGERWLENATTGGFAITLQAAGGSATTTLTAVLPKDIVACDGTDITSATR